MLIILIRQRQANLTGRLSARRIYRCRRLKFDHSIERPVGISNDGTNREQSHLDFGPLTDHNNEINITASRPEHDDSASDNPEVPGKAIARLQPKQFFST